MKQYAKAAIYAKPDQYCHMIFEEGDVLYVSEGNGFAVADDHSSVYRGIYKIGSDIQPGSHTIVITGIENSTVVATFANTSDVISYITWDSTNNLKEYSTYAEHVKDGVKCHISLPSEGYLYIGNGTGTLSTPEEGSITRGAYYVGKDIAPGSYVFNLSGIEGTAVIALFPNATDMLEYTSWDSINNLKKYSKLAIYAQNDVPFHFPLSDGDVLYVSAGEGTNQSDESDALIRGIYVIGDDIPAGSYTIQFREISKSSVVATFLSGKDLTSYLTWDSPNNLKEFSTSNVKFSDGEQIHILLPDGELLYITDGIGTFVK